MKKRPFGLYIHIPFCAKICHYCDFAKTANFGSDHVAAYVEALVAQLRAWSNVIPEEKKFTSVFFGGGTPGLLSRELEPLMDLIHEHVVPDAEITIEANPANVTKENITIWRDLGVNRLSIGVQTFDDIGLKVLTRDHTPDVALNALELAAKYFSKSNGDLIYGWNGQSMDSWQHDMETMLKSGVNHLSLYALTYEGQTPFARAERRGVTKATSDDELASFYDEACAALEGFGFNHEEISNWSRPGATCEHNWLYWRGEEYVGIGAGAHGFVDDGSPIGLRYQYEGDFRRFLKSASKDVNQESLLGVIASTGGVIDRERDVKSWLLEYVGCGLRSSDGVNLNLMSGKGFSFNPTELIKQAFSTGLMHIDNHHLKLSETEWFRETAWSFEVCESMERLS